MEYTVQQQEALSLMRDFIEDDKSIFILSGYAGTGKTTLISPLLDMISTTGKYCLLMAPTGRAAKILSSKTQKEASTIHKCIYDYSNLHVCGSENEESSVKYLFPLGQIINFFGPGCPMSPKDVIIIVDEASMVSSRESSDEMFIFGSGVLLDDLINFSRLNDGGKIIFIGDPAQLPPVTDNLSCALSQDFFRDKGISVSAYELNEIVRQIDGSVILSNSIKIRDHIFQESDAPLELRRKAGETEDIKYEEMAAKYCSINPVPSMNSSVIICYTNAAAAAYNKAVREIYYPGHTEALNIGDTLMIASNNYPIDDGCVLFNGTFAAVQECGRDIETQYGFVYINDDENREGKKKCIRIELKFTDVTLMLDDGNIVSAKLLVSLLGNDKPNLTYYEHCALISNFCLRNRQLTPNTYVFNEALRHDPYYNAIRAKFGYAITCHKAQG